MSTIIQAIPVNYGAERILSAAPVNETGLAPCADAYAIRELIIVWEKMRQYAVASK